MARVLLVEDSATQAVEMRLLLEEGAHQVMHVENGKLALEILEQHPIELVVTDLEMPEMNGLELVEAMQLDYQHIPAVLVTGRGSEELASTALQKGAAGYVPKNHLQALLNDTIIDVLGVIRSDASFGKLIATLQKNVFVFELPNDADLVSPLVGLLMQVIPGMDLISGNELVRLGMAVEHALINAIFHGNLELTTDQLPSHRGLVYDDASNEEIDRRRSSEPYRDRKVYVDATACKQEIRIVVRDQGKGFDTSNVPKASDPKALDSESGRGLVLMASFVDKLIFNDAGNEVTLVKHCRQQ